MTSFPQRKSPCLKDYDYRESGAYFVAICTHQRICLFGKVVDGAVALNRTGETAVAQWSALPSHHVGIELDAFVVMPNHIHGIVVIVGTTPASSAHLLSSNTDEAGLVPTARLGTVIGSYKSGVTHRIHELVQEPELRIWQAGYYDHIVRSELDLNRIRAYIETNPSRWAEDKYYSAPDC